MSFNQKSKCQLLFEIAVTFIPYHVLETLKYFFLTEEFVHFFIRKQFCTKLMKLSVLKIKSTFIEKQTSIHIGAIICQSDRFYSNLSLSFFLKQMIYWSWQDLSSYQYQCDCQAVFVLPKVEWVGISVWIGKLVFQKVQQYSSFSWDRG